VVDTSNAPPPKPPPSPGAGIATSPPSAVSLPLGGSGSSPSNVTFARLSVPDAAATPSTSCTASSADASKVAVPGATVRRELFSSVVPSAPVAPSSAPNSNPTAGPPSPSPGAAAACETVRSVPTPYTDSSTAACASRTPVETAFTIMTSAIASAIPIAMIAVCRRRPASSRRR
jgi:hypothetical protein